MEKPTSIPTLVRLKLHSEILQEQVVGLARTLVHEVTQYPQSVRIVMDDNGPDSQAMCRHRARASIGTIALVLAEIIGTTSAGIYADQASRNDTNVVNVQGNQK